ncbi:hypothetical protein LPJ78_001449 [Coemansia sp. RSA 989]|nr:hypothetical protein BX667DRAFT_508572 [Coemansia mojavensis]KAJ1740171.1 hypothetical protein LPJ68_004001 [Coemansia sp. RSA 1086]KAJ1752170.1 hypothetical protein LPJ79_001466 [Coemansia sp. RSA 1821]KAJ1866912.1 hypothetical protein LPJ78_001449 [Coemansia sp. RSA 989]KAJ1874267.1 hypothetical protein LPJ55_001642 [Coemansia sp. RSA 990]KAJ2632645.1 hypothetical protein H4R22_001112 [Coemansia sp. RSA 1290]KAJ2651128.1 hypothetical protein IWW40_001898 [Coemansia sp. RSA 1250]KAJ26729
MASLPLIRISPSEFQFTETRSGYTSRLRLTSLQHQAVGFKFKTNAPHKFLVKPVVCSLPQKGMSVDVIVKSSSPITDVDRFLIQTVALAAEEAENLDSTKWRTIDPSRIMEDLVFCTIARRRSASQSSSQSGNSPLLAVSDMQHFTTQQVLDEKSDRRLANSFAKRVYAMVPALDIADFSWFEFALFAAICFMLGFALPLARHLLF